MKDNAISKLLNTVKKLRDPDGGCPWDLKQSPKSLPKFAIEEAYEFADAVSNMPKDLYEKGELTTDKAVEELGDVLLQVALHAQIASESGAFDFSEVADRLDKKLVSRHPHVFGEASKLASADQVLVKWEAQKAKERAQSEEMLLDSIPKSLPALQRAEKIISRVAKVGFQWPNLDGPLAKMREELAEFDEEISKLQIAYVNISEAPADAKAALESELGDLLFTVCNTAHFLKLSPEGALQQMLKRFQSRFEYIERAKTKTGKEWENLSLDDMDDWWREAKQQEPQKP